MTRPTLLIDGNNLMVRAVEATRRAAMTSPTGVDTSALVSFTKTLSRHVREEKPFRAVVLWDGGHARRKALFPAYKANRPEGADAYRNHSRTLIREFLDLCGVPQQHVEGEEADDLIASHWRTANSPVVILSNDKDLLQMVGVSPLGQPTVQIRLSSWDTPTDRWDTARVTEHYGCLPAQLPLVMSLAGDTSDNIPGVHRIGMKTAVKHLTAAAWDLEAVTHPGIAAARDDGSIHIYRQLVDLRDGSNVPVATATPFMPTTPGEARWTALNDFLNLHGLRDIQRRLIASELW